MTVTALSSNRGSWQKRFPCFREIVQKRLGKCAKIGMAACFGSVFNRGNFSVIVEQGRRLWRRTALEKDVGES